MQVCFIIDNSPLTRQKCSQNTSINNLHASLTVLDTIKIAIETTLNDLSKSAAYIWDAAIFHLFVTSNPSQYLSSFEHDKLHFNYQLKEIRTSDTLTFPAETIKFALKHVSKFRMMAEAETVVGYRKCYIYEPVLVFFFSYGITLRTLAKLESKRLEKSMRSEYKFTHLKICYPSQNDKNFSKNKAQMESSPENLRWVGFAQKMNKGWHRNVFKYQGKQSLSETLTKCFASYKPSLCAEFSFEFDIKTGFADYFKNSDISIDSIMGKEQQSRPKVELYKIDENYGNYIPIPFEVSYTNNINGLPEIQEIEPIQFYVDLSRKLTGTISNLVSFMTYGFANPTTRFLKLEKQLQRLGITNIFFPLFMKIPNPATHQKQKCFYLSGFLHFAVDPKVGNIFELMITYPNFPYIEWIINLITNQKSYSDARQVQKLLIDYHFSIPQFYHRFIGQYFKFVSARIPAVAIYETIAANHWNKHLAANSSQFKNSIEQLQIRIRKAVNNDYEAVSKLRKENEDAHIQGRATCCPIYNKVEEFINYQKRVSIAKNPTSNSANTLTKLLEKVFASNQKYGFNSYFNGQQTKKEGPMTRELNKYMQKAFINEGNGGNLQIGAFPFTEANQSINAVPAGLVPSKKVKKSDQKSEESLSQNQQKYEGMDIEGDSQFPSKQRGSLLEYEDSLAEQSPGEEYQSPHLVIAEKNDFMMPNSVAVDALIRNTENLKQASKIIETERALLLNKINAEKDVRALMETEEIQKKGESQNVTNSNTVSLMSNEMQSTQRQFAGQPIVPALLAYANRIKEQGSKIMRLNTSCLKMDKFEQNLRRLERIGFIPSASSYLSSSSE